MAGSHGGSHRWRRLRSGRGTEEGESVRGREREQRGRKRGEGTRGVLVASLGRPGEAGGGRGGVGARHRAASVRGEEEDKGEGGGGLGQREELGRLGWTGKRQVSLCFIFFCSVLFYLICFASVLNLKIIQTMPKTPLNILYC